MTSPHQPQDQRDHGAVQHSDRDAAASAFKHGTKPAKPLKAKAYGSIGHLPCSRIGPGDHFVHEGQQAICTTKPRKGDRIIVTEKLDGACMSVANVGGELVALSRAGYRASDALYEHLKVFDAYVTENRLVFEWLLSPGERIVGEWLAMAHGTIYEPEHLHFSPFVAFDIFRDGKRILFDEFRQRCQVAEIRRAFCIHDSGEPLAVASAIELLSQPDIATVGRTLGFHGALEPVEGAVWRVEREDRVDFLAKFVRHDKVDGKYLPNISGVDPIWHWSPPGDAMSAPRRNELVPVDPHRANALLRTLHEIYSRRSSSAGRPGADTPEQSSAPGSSGSAGDTEPEED